MGKKAKMFKAFVAGLLAVNLAFVAPTGGILKAEAAQFNGESFGVGFAGEEYATMHRADGWSNGGMFNCTWRAANIWFDGYLNIKIDRDNATGGYSAGEYRTNDTFGYGMYDVSMKAIKNDGVVTSFFTYTGPSDGTVWDEIDIEILGKDTTKVQFNYYTNGVGNHEYVYNLGFDASQGFHQYGFLWLPGRITWYVDGKEAYTATNNIPTTPGRIMMNAWPGTGVDEWLKPYNGRTPLVAQYDWINYKKVDGGSSNNTTNNNTSNNTTANNTNNNSNTGGTPVGSGFTIEAENFTYMSGVEAAGGCVGYIDPGDWMSYEINVANAGTYSVAFHVASALGSSFRLEKDAGKQVLATVDVPNTGSWGTYKVVYKDVYLTAGKNNIAIATDRGGFNIDKMVFTAKGGSSNATTSVSNTTTNNSTTNNNATNNNTQQGSFNSTTPYKLINRNSGKALDIAWGSQDNGANILQYSYNGYSNQKWYLEPTGDGYYVIKSVATGKVVDVSGRSTKNGGDVIQWQSNGGWNQQWKIESVGDGYYKLINRNSGKALDTMGASTADNADVIQWDYSGGWNQQWKIEAAY